MAGANLATPLYAVYAHRFGFSSLVLTTIFATYAAVLVPTLVLFGRLSDRVGRRPVVVGGLAVAAGGLALFCFADGPVWLYAARAVQGLAVGMISGAATAALVELDPHGDRRRAALFAGLAQAGGSAAGPMVAGVLAQWAPDPLRLPFLRRPRRDRAGRSLDARAAGTRGAAARAVAHRVAARARTAAPLVRPRQPHRRNRVGGGGALSLDRAVVRVVASAHARPRAARPSQRSRSRVVVRDAGGRARPPHNAAARRGARPLRPRRRPRRA